MTTERFAHLEDGDLLRLMDGEGEAAERLAWEAHLRRCDACTREAGQLRHDADTVRRWLDHAAYEEADAERATGAARPGARRPLRSWRAVPPWARAAAALALLAAPLAAFPSVREWVADRVADRSGAADPVTTAADRAVQLRFEPAPGRFDVVFLAFQEGATLTVARASGHEAVLAVDDTRAAPAATVSAAALRVDNAGAGAAAYRLLVPASVTALWVEVGGDLRTRLDPADIDAGRVVPLAPR